MNKLIITLVFCSFITLVYGQENRQPKNGIPVLTEQMNKIRYSNVKVLGSVMTRSLPDNALPDFIDNSKLKYFPPVFNQTKNSCAFASGVGYIYNYELNCLLDRECVGNDQILNYLHVYSYLNEGKDKGGFAEDAWTFIKSNGCPSKKYSKVSDIFEWSNGYNTYFKGMPNRVKEFVQVNSTSNNIQKMKQFLVDHGDGSAHGGLIQFSAWAHPLDPQKYNGNQSTGYDAIIPYFGNSGMHSMTIVGYDDTVEFDFSGDNIIQENEKGAFICVNTWGPNWGNSQGCRSGGKFYAPYYTFTTLKQSEKNVIRTKENMGGGTGNGGKNCFMVIPKILKTKVTFKVRMIHDSRNDLKLRIGVSPSLNTSTPAQSKIIEIMKSNGGDKPLRGKNGESYKIFEFGIDLTDLLQYVDGYDEMSFFLDVIDDSKGAEGQGEILYCSLLDYRHDSENPREILASLNSSTLNANSTCTAIAKIKKSQIEEGVNTDIIDFWSNYEKKLTLILDSKEEAQLEVDILDESGNIISNKVSKMIEIGPSTVTIDANDLEQGTYAFRIILDNKFIYKKFKIQ